MARKTSDPVLLLRSIGKNSRRRGKSGVMGGLGRVLTRWVSGSSVAGLIGGPGRRTMAVPGWATLGLALVCLGGGILIGRHFVPVVPGTGLDATAPGRRAPGLLDEEAATAVLANEAFIVAQYEYVGAAARTEAKDKALRLSGLLEEQGFEYARPYPRSGLDSEGNHRAAWFVVVYFSTEGQKQATATALKAVAEQISEPAFVKMREIYGDRWPISKPISVDSSP